jgi:hypothetical protein
VTVSLDLDVVERLLGVPPHYPPWRVADRAIRGGILATWLSTMVARDRPVSDQAMAYLDRTRRRVGTLHRLGEEMAVAHGLTVIKGPRIARYLPEPLLRQSGDVDLVAPDQESLWRCVLDFQRRLGARPQGVSVLDGPAGVHVGVAMKWPAEEPYLDKPMGADITTCAFGGDLRTVPVRVAMPDEDDLRGLFAVAEERFQHKYRVKDRLDLLVLARVLEDRLGDRLQETVCGWADRLALAPELRSLIRRTDEWVPVPERWREIRDALGPLSRAEKTRRRPDRPGMLRLRFGYPLDDVSGPGPAVTVHRRDRGDVATTPIGTCLLVERRVLDEDTVADAVAFARALAEERVAEPDSVVRPDRVRPRGVVPSR